MDENLEKPKTNLIFQEIVTSFEKSTFHALPKIIRSKNRISRILWLLLFVLCTGYCTKELRRHIIDFLEYEVLTFVDYGYETPAVFPAITICGISIELNKTLKNCTIYIGERSLPVTCDSAYFLPTNVPGYYNSCYIFENGTLYKENETNLEFQKELGIKRGLKFEFFNLNNSIGYDAFIHNHSLCALNEQNIILAPKIYNEVGLKRTNMIKMSEPYSDCITDTNVFPGETLNYFQEMSNETKYSQKLCYTFCIKYYLNKNCSKYYSNITKLYDGKKCGETVNKIFNICSEKCLVECDSMILSLSILTKNQASNENYTTLIVYYEETRITRINEVPAISLEKLLGNIGYVILII
jgi:hypothetical protein